MAASVTVFARPFEVGADYGEGSLLRFHLCDRYFEMEVNLLIIWRMVLKVFFEMRSGK